MLAEVQRRRINPGTYRGYAIEVRCEHEVDAPQNAAINDEARHGFIAIVHMRSVDGPSFFLAPIRLADKRGDLFTDSLDALHAGQLAEEIIVDDLLVDVDLNTQR